MTPDQLVQIAEQAARAGAQAALRYFRADDLDIEIKADASPVTIADREAEAAIKAIILQALPEDGWLGEETGTQAGSTGREWIVDPIDGTKNFVHGVPLWATLVACRDAEGVLASCVLIPALGECFTATRGGGAWCDGKQIHVSDKTTLATSLFCYETPAWFKAHGLTSLFDAACASTYLQRGLCDAYGHMLVASGRAECVIEPELSVWDVAATSLVVTEAGGTFCDLAGADSIESGNAVVSNGHVHAELMQLISSHRP